LVVVVVEEHASWVGWYVRDPAVVVRVERVHSFIDSGVLLLGNKLVYLDSLPLVLHHPIAQLPHYKEEEEEH
jgi:hypothetical protein